MASFWSLPSRRATLLAPLTLAGLLAVVFIPGMLPGVGEGDTAEFQYMSSTLGICHSPGYQIQTFFGKGHESPPARRHRQGSTGPLPRCWMCLAMRAGAG